MRQIMITGRLGSDAEIKQTKQGQNYISFRIANNEYGDAENDTHWYRVTSFNNRYVNMSKYLKKGSAVIIIGDYKDELYQNNEGRCMISRDIVANVINFNETSPRQDNNGNNGNYQQQSQTLPFTGNDNNVDGVRMPSMGAQRQQAQPNVQEQKVVQNVAQQTSSGSTDIDDLPF